PPPVLVRRGHRARARRPPPRLWRRPTRRSARPAAPPSTPPPARGWRPAGPTEQATLKRVLIATVRGAGKAPASVLSTGSAAPRRAELGRATRFSSLVAAPGHGGLISKVQGTAVRTAVSPARARP